MNGEEGRRSYGGRERDEVVKRVKPAKVGKKKSGRFVVSRAGGLLVV
jgi:hypothetical protein